MSRTDKTKPWWVRVVEHNPKMFHDHEDGICDLPDDPKARVCNHLGCHADARNLMYPTRDWGCGCRMCTDQEGRKAKRRKERKQAKNELAKDSWDPREERIW